jgi:hypothetical protein
LIVNCAERGPPKCVQEALSAARSASAEADEHAPHISAMGGYVYTASLDKLFTAAATVLASEKVTSWKLKAFKYYYIPLKEIGLGGILAEPTADMIRLQKELIDAAAPFMAPAISGTAAAFATTLKGPKLTSPPSTRLQTIFPDTQVSITARTSRSESAQETIWTPCWLRRFPRSRFRLWECPPISSATSELQRNDFTHSS